MFRLHLIAINQHGDVFNETPHGAEMTDLKNHGKTRTETIFSEVQDKKQGNSRIRLLIGAWVLGIGAMLIAYAFYTH
jgi:hypothetical protein